MTNVVVTGGAGFIGSRLALALLEAGNDVTVIDRVSDYYDTNLKHARLRFIKAAGGNIIEADLVTMDLLAAMRGVDVVYHQAGQPGVRKSWSTEFQVYCQDNVVATQLLLEAATHANVRKIVYASSSSIYGENSQYPVSETSLPSPLSPYGVTKLAAEHLVNLYAANFKLETVCLRYVTGHRGLGEAR